MRHFTHTTINCISIDELIRAYKNEGVTDEYLGCTIEGSMRDFERKLYCDGFKITEGGLRREGKYLRINARIVGMYAPPRDSSNRPRGILIEFPEDIYEGHSGTTNEVCVEIPHNEKGCWWIF